MSPHATGALRLPWQDDRDEALARRAAAGDGAAFATLYDRYERRAYNLCYRITGSPEDAADATQETFAAVLERLPRLEGRELNFGSYLMTAARNASYDAIARRKRATPAGDLPDSAVPIGAGGEDPERPERHALRAAHQEQIRVANASLPPRQREVLALRELEELSYDAVAEVMGMNRNSVAQLISRARINLRDSLRQTALGSVAAASPLCERALPLLAMRQDDALDEEPSAWLAEHLAGCSTCRVRVEAMEEAGVAYRLWLPLVPALWLRGEAIAHAAERVGADWNAAPRRPRHLRLAAAGGALLATAFLLAPADHALTPTRAFPPPAVAGVPAPAPVVPAVVERRAKPRAAAVGRRAPKPRAAPRAPARDATPVVDAPSPPADVTPVLAAAPDASRPPANAEPAARVRRPPAPERRRDDPPAADAAPASDPVASPGDVAQTPETPTPPAGEPVAEPPCPTATTAAACPPPRPPVTPTCTDCQVAVPRPQPAPARILTARPALP